MGRTSSIPRETLAAIQEAYENSTPPAVLAKKYGVKASMIHSLAYVRGWTKNKERLFEQKLQKIRDSRQDNLDQELVDIKRLSSLAREAIKNVLTDPDAKHSDKINAAKAVFDIDGSKVQTQNITGGLKPQVKYVLPEEWEEVNKHIEEFINN